MTDHLVLCPSCKTRTFVQDAPWKLFCVNCYLLALRKEART